MIATVASHEVLPGETLSGIARKYKVSLNDLVAANPQIAHPDLILVGQIINIPGSPAPAIVAPSAVAPPTPASNYDGIHPAPGTTSLQRAHYARPPLTNTLANRSAAIYNEVIDQFAVAYNPRYLPGGGYTWCNIFLWDVTRAMGAEIPHWVTNAGAIARPGAVGAHEININGGVTWMNNHGAAAGWRTATPQEAQAAANAGKVAVVMWKNPTGGHGHTAVIRPGTVTGQGATTAQAGSRNFNLGHVKTGFGFLNSSLKYFWHA